jgi:hypothetical protein
MGLKKAGIMLMDYKTALVKSSRKILAPIETVTPQQAYDKLRFSSGKAKARGVRVHSRIKLLRKN